MNSEIDIHQYSKNILSNNEFFFLLNNIMQNNDMRNLLNKYGKNWTDMKTVIMYIKTYELIENIYQQIYNKKINNNLLIFILQNLFINGNTRKFIVEKFSDFSSQINNKNFIDYFQNNISRELLTKIPENILKIN